MARIDPHGKSPQLQWHDKKCDLPERVPGRVVLARDVNTKGAKEFVELPSAAAAARFATGQVTQPVGRRKNHLYEVLEDSRDPVRLFFDLDSKGNAFTSTQVASSFRAALAGYLASVHAVQLDDLTVQMSEASRPGKTSVHAVVDLEIASMMEHKRLSMELTQYIIGHGERFAALQVSETECVLDLAVYTNFRSFRMLGMCKLSEPGAPAAVLRALPGSSSSVLDHMVGVHSQRPCAAQLQTRCKLVPPSLSGTSRSARPAATQVPRADAVKYADMLNSWPDVQRMFPGGALQVHSAVHTEERIRVRLAPNTVCPYAKRVHRSNNLYVNLYHARIQADVECYDAECMQKMDMQGRTSLMNPASQQTALHDSVHESMHAQFDNIKWHDLYDEPRMRPLPLAPLVCVRAGMGLGKTEEVKVLLNEQCPIGPNEQKTVLIVTFSRKLADKCYEDFQHLDFINYQAHDGQLNQARIIVCLDSLNRVVARNFDFIIVDEACSVILHFNSPLMQDTSTKSFLLEALIKQAKHVYLVDAMLDTTFMKNIVDYFAMAKGEDAVWVCNTHVRPSNRVASIVHGKAGMGKAIGTESLVFAAARKVLDLLNDGKRVVCCSSTKKFTEVLELYISQMRPGTSVLVLNSKSEQKSADVTNCWSQHDLLVYSPSISAGVSFTAPHFDSLVGYLVNSKYTPTVDIALQQLFRVRQLAAGDMHLYVQDTASPSAEALPHTMEKVAQMLHNDIALVTAGGHTAVSTDLSFAAQNTFKDNRVQYDQDRLSYRVILGIVLTANRSAVSFTDLLVGTLREDYGIPVSKHTVIPKERGYDADITILAEAQRPKEVPHFDSVTCLTPPQFAALSNQSEHTDAEKASIKLFQGATHVWGVSMDRVDSAFYNKLVMASSAADHYYRARRLNEACRLTLEENRTMYDRKMQKVLASDDYNLELYRTRTRRYYEMLIAGQALLIGAMGVKERDSLQHQQVVTMLDTELEAVLARYWKAMGPKKAACVRKLFSITAGKDAKLTVGKVLRHAFDIVISHADYNKDRPAYHTLRFQLNKEALLAQCYEPTFPSRCSDLSLAELT